MVYLTIVGPNWRREALVLIAACTLLVLAVVAALRPRAPSPPAVAEQGTVVHTAPGGNSEDAVAGVPSGAHTLYTVAAGDTLSTIAARFGTTLETLMAANGLTDPDAIFIGQELRLSIVPDREGPAVRTVPDSEVVFGKGYLDFDPRAFVASRPGPLSTHQELVDGEALDGAQIVERVAREFSVGPRVLLAMIEARGGWVTGAAVPDNPSTADYPAGLVDPNRAGLWRQLNWLADRLNGGYYDWKTRDNRLLTLADGTHLAGHPSLGPGSFAVQRVLGLQSTEAELAPRLAAFEAAYRGLFGNQWAREVAMPATGAIAFPPLELPFAKGETWWLTGGPHGGWADGSAWSALDFVPDDVERGCYVSPGWVTAVADGVVLGAGAGQLLLDLDGDGLRQTGPGVFYLHLAPDDLVAPGTHASAGDRLGHPSCDGGTSNATHLHIARTLDGEWLAAGGSDPFALGDWVVSGSPESYAGGMTRAGGGRTERREACECRQAGYNDIAW